jgi:histidinol-phosphate phosphatase family protein
MKAVIVAGGRGTRMRGFTETLPKPMIKIGDKPLLEHQIQLAGRYDIKDVIVLTGYKREVIENYFGNGEKWGVNIRYHCEDLPLGTAGAVKAVEDWIGDDFLVFYGDVLADMNLKRLIDFHKRNKPTATLVLHPNSHPFDSDLVDIDENNRITHFYSKPHQKGKFYRNLVSAALYVCSKEIFNFIDKGVYSDFGKDVFPRVLRKGDYLLGYLTSEYLRDIGTPERYEKVCFDYLSGRVNQSNISNKQKAIFLDRDGVINEEKNLVYRMEDFRLLPKVPEAIREINLSGYLAVVVTNQPVVARGLCSIEDIRKIHNKMETLLGREGAYLDRIYFCPHHPDQGYPEENPEFKIDCQCRKPKIGLIQKACEDLNIDLKGSFCIGDSTTDIQTAKTAGMPSVLVRTGFKGEDGKYPAKPDFTFSNLKEAVNFIIYDYPLLEEKAFQIFEKTKNKKSPLLLIGGASRSGKSTFAQVVKIAFNKKGKKLKVLELDHWILDVDRRTDEMMVKERYDYEKIVKSINMILRDRKVELPQYDLKTRKRRPETIGFQLRRDEGLIVEGAVALDIPKLRKKSDYAIYLGIPDSVRRERFLDFYSYKELPSEQIQNLFEKRERDEFPIIKKTKRFADLLIEAEEVSV